MDTHQKLTLLALFLGTNALTAFGFYYWGNFRGFELGAESMANEIQEHS